MRLLVTGSSGLIGQVMVAQLKERHEVVGFDCKAPEGGAGDLHFVQGDLLDRQALAGAMEGVEAVIHLAAVPYDIPPLHQVFSTNVQGTYHALELAVEAGAKVFLHASSIMAYGFGQNADPLYFPVDEEHPLRANRPYGLSKIVGEQLCRSFTERCGLRTLCFRLTGAVAPGKRYDWYPCQERNMEVGIYQYFDVRDFTALAEKAIAADTIEHEVFLVSAVDSGHAEPTAEVIARYYPQAELRYERLEEDSPFVSVDRARRMLGWEPEHTWKEQREG